MVMDLRCFSFYIVSHSKVLTLSVLQWTIALSPPPTDAPNAGDPTGPLRIGNFIIEGVDRVLVELRDHVIVFYNELITLMNAAGLLWQLIRKERYDQIKEALILIRISRFGNQHIYVGYQTEKFTLPVLPITVLVW